VAVCACSQTTQGKGRGEGKEKEKENATAGKKESMKRAASKIAEDSGEVEVRD